MKGYKITENAFSCFGQNVLHLCLLHKNINSCACYACEVQCLTQRAECQLWVFVNRVVRKMCGPDRRDVTGVRESCIMRASCFLLPAKFS